MVGQVWIGPHLCYYFSTPEIPFILPLGLVTLEEGTSRGLPSACSQDAPQTCQEHSFYIYTGESVSVPASQV